MLFPLPGMLFSGWLLSTFRPKLHRGPSLATPSSGSLNITCLFPPRHLAQRITILLIFLFHVGAPTPTRVGWSLVLFWFITVCPTKHLLIAHSHRHALKVLGTVLSPSQISSHRTPTPLPEVGASGNLHCTRGGMKTERSRHLPKTTQDVNTQAI